MSQESSKGEIIIVWFCSGIGIALILGSLMPYSLSYLGHWQDESLRYAYFFAMYVFPVLFLTMTIYFISNRLRRQG